MKREREEFTAWITKYALTKGILERHVELCADISDDMVSVINNEWHECYHGSDWHRTREAAVARAKEMRANKLVSLRAQMTRVAGLDFA